MITTLRRCLSRSESQLWGDSLGLVSLGILLVVGLHLPAIL